MFNRSKNFFIGILVILCVGCTSGKSGQPQLQTTTVALQPSATPLYFTGIIQPIQIYSINTPVDGLITQKYFDYGENVKNGQLLLVLSSMQLQQDYQNALADYLKTKKEYSNNQIQMRGTDLLKKLGIISEDEYLSDKSTSYDLALTYAQATNKLQAILAKAGYTITMFKALQLGDTQAVNRALVQPINTLKIVSPANGITLMPDKNASTSTDDNSSQPLTIGSQVKTGQSLLMIGDMSGLIITIKVNEIHINDIQVGQKAIITGDAFPDITLQGKVIHVNQQAINTDSETTPTFPVKIVVSQLTDEQRKHIHVGMSANVELQLTQSAFIKLPITAVFTQNGKTMVNVVDKNTQKIHAVSVTTGTTTLDSVEIKKGLNPGDEVVINAATH